MFLYYDRISKMYSLEIVGGESGKRETQGLEFLGPMTHAKLRLKALGFTESQSREAVLQAFFKNGQPIDLQFIKSIA